MPNKSQFVEALAERLDGDKKRASAALDAVISTVYASVVKGEKVALTGFGVFEKRERAARTARNPATGAPVKVKKTQVPAFRPGAEFKAIISGARKIAKAPAKKATAAKKTTQAKTTAKKAAPAKKATAAKATATKASPVKKAAAAKSTATKTTAATKSSAKKGAAKKSSR